MSIHSKKIMLAFVALLLLVSGILLSKPDFSSAATTTYKTTDTLNVRLGPGTTYKKVTSLKKNTVVTKVKASSSWWQIRYSSSKLGWVNSKYLKAVTTVTATTPAKTTYFYVTEKTGLNMRKSYSVSSAKVGVNVPYGTKVKISKTSANGWVNVTYKGKTGWISADSSYGFKSTANISYTTTVPKEIQYVTVKGTLNVRSLPSTSAPKLGTITKTYAARILKLTNTNWAEVQYSKENTAWISLNTSTTTVTTEEPQQISDPINNALAGLKIVVDPGHGGTDPGAVGKDLNGKKVTEAELTLASAKALKTAIENVGGTVSMTRASTGALSSNKSTDLSLRAAAAAKVGANAFISIHYNSAPNASANGLEALYYQSTSKKFAQTIHDNIVEAVEDEYGSAKNRGVKYQNVAVLRENSVFGTLVELGFMSNPTELSRINTDKFRNTVAEGIVNGLIEYYNK